VVIVCCGLPFVRLLAEIVATGGAAFGVWDRARPWLLLARSVLLAGAVTVCALSIGITMGLLIARSELRARATLWLLHAFPFLVPPFLLALGWFHTLGQSAPLGTALTSRLLFSEVGLIAILALAFSPVASSLVVLALMGVDASLEEAARVAARPWRVATRILLPAAGPAIVLAAAVIFAFAVSELGVPMFLRVDVFPAAVFSRLGGLSFAPGEAIGLAAPLIPIALALLLIERRFAGAGALAISGLHGMSRSPLPLGRWRPAWTVAAWSIALAGVLPIGALFLQATTNGGFSDLSASVGRAAWTSLSTALFAALVISLASIVIGHAAARGSYGAAALDAIAMLAFLTPATVLGIGLIDVWGGPETRVVYGSVAILAIGNIARYSAIGIRATRAVMLQSPLHLEEAAATVGAGYWRRLSRIVVPANARALVATALLAMVFCLRDFETAVLYYPPGREPLPVRIFTLEANGAPAVIAALASTQVLLTAAVCAAALLFVMRGAPR
jgi:iron(III) transport system permease protein